MSFRNYVLYGITSFGLGCNSTTNGKLGIWSRFFIKIKYLIILGEKLPSVFADITNNKNNGILAWIKQYRARSSAKLCKKKQNYHKPHIEFRNFLDERQEKAWVGETARVGHLVSVVSVTDQDLEDSGEAVLNITKGNEEGQFTLETVGDVHVVRVAGRGQLDWETASQYQLTVMAEDGGSPPRSATATLFVNVTRKYKTSFFLIFLKSR